jgi:hypothetical protein
LKLSKTILSGLLLLFSSALYAQSSGVLKGKIIDSASRQPLKGATIAILNVEDSSVVLYGFSKEDGSFQIEKIPFDSYYYQVSFSGLAPAEAKFTVSAAKAEHEAGSIYLNPSSKLLEEVVIRTAPLVVNGDTLEFDAARVKTIPNATTEDLLKKLPGVEVDKDGTVKAQGENVTRILVDGKKFFGSDPKLATRNLPADIIDKIQVIDALSEQSEFTGFDDGNRVKTINIVTKKDRRKGWFGKASAGIGTNDRTANSLSANRFNGNQQISLVGQYNNVNNQNFSIQDFLGAMSTGGSITAGARAGGGSNRAGGGSANLFAGNASGIPTTKALGINYNDTWSKKTMANASVFYNNINAVNNRDRYRETFLLDEASLFNTNTVISKNSNENYRANFEIDHRFDTLNSVLVRPEYSTQSTDNYSTTNSYTTKGTTPLNELQSQTNSKNSGYNFSNSVLYRHRFRNPGQTLSINLTQGFNTNDRYSTTLSYNHTFGRRTDTLDQVSSTQREGENLGANLSFTQRVTTRSQLELTYSYNHSENKSDQQTFRLNKQTGKRDLVVPNLTNLFENSNESQRAGINYRVQLSSEWNYALGMAVQHAELTSDNLSKKTFLQQSFVNFFPNFNIQFRKSRARNLRFNYRGSTQQPSITQLQDVIDNTNVLNIRSGNPALRQEFNNNFNFVYNTVNVQTFQSFSLSLNASTTSNKIATAYTINTGYDSILVDGYKLGPGAQFSKPKNMDGAFSVGGNISYSFPVVTPKSNVTLSSRISFNRDVNLVNDAVNYTRNYVLGGGLRITMNLKERFDLNFSGNTTYSLARYSVDKERNGDFLTYRLSVEPTYISKTGWTLSNDFDYIMNRGQSDGFNESIPLWNAGLAKLFMKNKQAEIRLSVFDLLDQNKSITRNVEQNYVEDVRSQVLNRYFLLSFTYNLRNFKGLLHR